MRILGFGYWAVADDAKALVLVMKQNAKTRISSSRRIMVYSRMPLTQSNIFKLSAGRIFTGENSRYHGLHQTSCVAAAVPAHEAAAGVAGGVESRDRVFACVQRLTTAVHQDATHGESNARHDSESTIRRAQRFRSSCSRNG